MCLNFFSKFLKVNLNITRLHLEDDLRTEHWLTLLLLGLCLCRLLRQLLRGFLLLLIIITKQIIIVTLFRFRFRFLFSSRRSRRGGHSSRRRGRSNPNREQCAFGEGLVLLLGC